MNGLKRRWRQRKREREREEAVSDERKFERSGGKGVSESSGQQDACSFGLLCDEFSGGGGLLLQEMIRSRYGYIIASEKNSKEDRRLARNSSESK